MVADKTSGRLLGAEIVGEGIVDKRIDVIASALECKATVEQISKYDLSYTPPYSSPMDPVITAANVLRNKMEGKTNSINPLDVKRKLNRGDDTEKRITQLLQQRRRWVVFVQPLITKTFAPLIFFALSSDKATFASSSENS
ncbi:MAG: hypothetical protein SCALA701_13750 [Candidatus Scalindua sp.]|nr:MAG: hypothetical protein SCALA701_13750 [Candidatus Scalindua sp.]